MRVVWELPITGPILKLIGCELIIEDHDLVGPRWGLSMMELIVYRHTSTTETARADGTMASSHDSGMSSSIRQRHGKKWQTFPD